VHSNDLLQGETAEFALVSLRSIENLSSNLSQGKNTSEILIT
jgi:hypothetical protein